MALEDTKEPYEILIRFNRGEDGETVIAAHQQRLRRIVLDGELIKEDVLPAEPLDLTGFPVSDLMTSVQQAAIARTTQLEIENREILAELTETRAKWGEDNRAKNMVILELNATVSALQKQIDTVQPKAESPTGEDTQA